MVRYRFDKRQKPKPTPKPKPVQEDEKPSEKPVEIKNENGKKIEFYKCRL